MKLLVGADPELFLKEKDQFVSAHGMVPGTKDNPYKVKNGAVQVDGMALEFNIDPSNNENEFKYNVKSVLEEMQNMIDKKYEFHIKPSVFFSHAHYKSQPPEAQLLGCDPDFNAYSKTQNENPNNNLSSVKGVMRTASGHVHVGWTEGEDVKDPVHFAACAQMARQLDYFLGLPSTLLEEPSARRRMYGQAGSFRPKPYGCEYRVLSNFWLEDDLYIDWVYSATKVAFESLIQGVEYNRTLNNMDRYIITIYINEQFQREQTNRSYYNRVRKNLIKGMESWFARQSPRTPIQHTSAFDYESRVVPTKIMERINNVN